MSIPQSLADLEAQFVTYRPRALGKVATLAEAQGVMFLCPACYTANGGSVATHSVLVWFRNRGVPDEAEPRPARWEAEGRDLSDLTLRPSIDLSPGSGCKWHGFVTNGSAK